MDQLAGNMIRVMLTTWLHLDYILNCVPSSITLVPFTLPWLLSVSHYHEWFDCLMSFWQVKD